MGGGGGNVFQPIGDALHGIGDSLGNIITAPVHAVGDLLAGQNIKDVFSKDIASAGASFEKLYITNASGGLLSATAQKSPGVTDAALSPYADKLTFGYSTDLVRFNQTLDKVQAATPLGADDINYTNKFALKSFALGGAGAAAFGGTTAPTTTKLATYYGGAQAASAGDLKGVANAIGPIDIGLPNVDLPKLPDIPLPPMPGSPAAPRGSKAPVVNNPLQRDVVPIGGTGIGLADVGVLPVVAIGALILFSKVKRK